MKTYKADGPLIVIPCLNEADHLPRLLTQLVEDAPPDALIVVADGGSTDGTLEKAAAIIEHHVNIHLLHNPKRIQSAGINMAVRSYGGGRRWMVRIDVHLNYPANYVSGLIAAAQRIDATAVVVSLATCAEQGRCFQAGVAAAQNARLATGGSAHRSPTAGQFVDHGHHALFSLDAFTAAGGYDETFSHNEDAELDVRLIRDGGRIWIEPVQGVVYYPRRTAAHLFRQYLKYGEGRAKTFQRHRMRLKLRQIAPLAIAPLIVTGVCGVILSPFTSGVSNLAATPALLWIFVSIGYGLILSLRAGKICAALSGAAALIMHSAWSLGFWRQIILGTPPGSQPAPLVLGSPMAFAGDFSGPMDRRPTVADTQGG